MFRKFASIFAVAASFSSVLAQNSTNTTSAGPPEYTLSAENITATFIPYGARITSCMVPDRNGSETQVIVGYDSSEQYIHDTETNHTYFGE